MITIPNPLRIACTECHRDMRVEFQSHETYNDSVIVAAECDCGRVLAEIDGQLCLAGWGRQARPFIASMLNDSPYIGADAKGCIATLRDRIATLERLIAAATWVRDKPRPT
jgi:hypothetical protein